MALAWVRTKNLLTRFFDNGETIVSLSMARFVRDRGEIRRFPPAGQVAGSHAVVDIVEAVVFVIAAFVVLITSRAESPPMPLRLWIIGYALQCIGHVTWLCMERWRRRQFERWLRNFNITVLTLTNLDYTREAIFFLWWIVGCCLFIQGAKASPENTAPQLTSLVIFYLAFDILLFFCAVLLVSLFGVFLACCSPLLYVFFNILGNPVYDDPPHCPFCESPIHKVTVRLL